MPITKETEEKEFGGGDNVFILKHITDDEYAVLGNDLMLFYSEHSAQKFLNLGNMGKLKDIRIIPANFLNLKYRIESSKFGEIKSYIFITPEDIWETEKNFLFKGGDILS